jgi:hypothetical protein
VRSMMCSVAAGEIEIMKIKVESSLRGGVVECWSLGLNPYYNTPVFHHSTVLCATAHEKQDNENWYGYAK